MKLLKLLLINIPLAIGNYLLGIVLILLLFTMLPLAAVRLSEILFPKAGKVLYHGKEAR